MKVKGVFTLVHKYCIMKVYESMWVKLHPFLASVIDGGEWSALCSCSLYPRGNKSKYLLFKMLGGT